MLKLRHWHWHWHWHCSSSSSSGIGLLGRQHMSSIILLNDPIPLTPFFFFFLSKGLHLNTLPPHPNPIIHMSSRITTNRINRGGGFTFNPNPNPNACLRDDDAFHKGNGNPMGNLRFAFPPQHLQLLIKENSTAPASESDASSHRGTLLRFPHHPLPPDKIVVAVDVDEVLGNFVSALNRFIADRYSFNHSVSEYHVYEFFKIWNCSRDEADIRVHEFFKTSYFKTGIHPIPGAQRTLHKLSRFCNLSVVTSRQNAIKDHTIEWIERHYPGLFQEIHFGNHFALDGESRPKSEICRSLGAKVLIDDNPRYAIECAKVGIRVLLFDYENSYPWCKTESVNQHPLVTKVHNWEEVEQKLISWTVS